LAPFVSRSLPQISEFCRSFSAWHSKGELRVIESNECCIWVRLYMLLTTLMRATATGSHSIAKALETIATGLVSAALRRVTRPKLMVRPDLTTRASASTSDCETARMKWVV